jgi:spore coat protein U-like protein
MSHRSALPVIAASLLAIAFGPRHAAGATASTSFGVSVIVQSACAVSATSMRFGTYTGAAANATSAITVKCTNSTPYDLALSAGLAPGATVANRKMSGPGAALLGYSLKSNNGKVVNWGDTVGIDTVSGTGDGSSQVFSVLGQIPAAQQVADGPYTDIITVTVIY